MARNSGNSNSGSATLDTVTSNAVSELSGLAQSAIEQAQAHAQSVEQAQANLNEAIESAQAANDRIVALGGDPLDLSGLPGATAPRRRRSSGRRASSGSSGSGSTGRTRPRNPYDFPTSVVIAMAGSRVGTEFNNDAIREALTSGGFQTSANETSFRTQITQNLGRIMAGETALPKTSVKQISRGVYALTSVGKKAVNGYSLSDEIEDESESE